MHVGLDGYPLSEARTGVGHYTFELARALAALAPSDEFQLVSPAPFQKSVLDELKASGLTNLQAVKPRATSLRGHWWAIGLPMYARRASFDLFHGTNFDVPMRKSRRRRSVVTIHDLSVLLHPGTHRARLVRRNRLRLPLAVRVADRIITPTESIRREVCEHLRVKPEKVIAIHAAPRAAFYPVATAESAGVRKRLKIKDNFILFVGTLEPRKNLLTLLRAYDQILKHSSNGPQLVIAGPEGWLMDELFAFIKQSGMRQRLCLTGYLPDEDLRALYSSCRAMIYPSIYEGFGLPPLEAMACGAPVIAGKIPALQETVGKAALLVEPLDVEALTAGIAELLENQARYEELSAAGIKRASKYSWERTARETLAVYRELVG